MEFHHIHFYVDNAENWRNWLIEKLNFEARGQVTHAHTHTEVVSNGLIYFLLSSPLNLTSPVAKYLQVHPPGAIDVAFQVKNLEAMVDRVEANGGDLLQPIQYNSVSSKKFKWAKIKGWNRLEHTLIETAHHPSEKFIPAMPSILQYQPSKNSLLTIDHVVLNVAAGQLNLAIQFYQNILGLQAQQHFNIQTYRSGLQSQVLTDASNSIKFPINQPTSETSQIHEFIQSNQGSGIQHIALKTRDILDTVTQSRQQQLPFLSVESAYYHQLQQRFSPHQSLLDWDKIQQSNILIDWQDDQPEALLLQIFTEPIFQQPTFFFELIERRKIKIKHQVIEAQGFGEGNFQALFEAVEYQQIQRLSKAEDDRQTENVTFF